LQQRCQVNAASYLQVIEHRPVGRIARGEQPKHYQLAASEYLICDDKADTYRFALDRWRGAMDDTRVYVLD
jgi:hypothetical protein